MLAVHSLSKRTNLAGYRGGFVAGDPTVGAELLAVRKNLGLILPEPAGRHGRRPRRRRSRRAAHALRGRRLVQKGAGDGGIPEGPVRGVPLPLVCPRRALLDTVDRLAERGILVAPGSFYGQAGAQHVRVAFTATDERVDAAVSRLA